MRRMLWKNKANADYELYKRLITTSSPFIYYQLNESSGNSITDSSTNNTTGTINGTYNLNQTSLIFDNSDKSIYLGSNGYISHANSITTSTCTIEAIFSKSGASNGVICGATSNQNDNSSTANWTFAFYLSNDGKINFYVYNNLLQPLTVTSSNSFNDGNPVIATATIGSRGIEIWVNNKLIVANSFQANIANGFYWHIGWGKFGASPGTTSYLNGTIDEIAIWHSQNTQAQIIARHAAAGF